MSKEQLTELLRIAYRWGRDNGEGRSEKNFNDFLEKKVVNKYIGQVESNFEALKEFAYEVCPLHREDDLENIIKGLKY